MTRAIALVVLLATTAQAADDAPLILDVKAAALQTLDDEVREVGPGVYLNAKANVAVAGEVARLKGEVAALERSAAHGTSTFTVSLVVGLVVSAALAGYAAGKLAR